MNKNWVWVALVIIVAVGVLGYVGRHKIKALLGMSTPAPVVETTQTSPEPTSAQAAAVTTDNIYKTASDPSKGNYLTDFQGMAVYSYDKDTSGVSNCYGGCATAWPPYTSGATAEAALPASVTVVTRTDGSKQFAWKGMPLYYFAKDKKAGDVAGDGVGGVWHLVKP